MSAFAAPTSSFLLRQPRPLRTAGAQSGMVAKPDVPVGDARISPRKGYRRARQRALRLKNAPSQCSSGGTSDGGEPPSGPAILALVGKHVSRIPSDKPAWSRPKAPRSGVAVALSTWPVRDQW